jgi:hypothetical protein
MKKIIKIVTIIVLLCIAFITIVPVVFEGKIIELVKKTANKNINATLDFEKADLSLFRSFPSTELTLQNLYITNIAPFEGDTLFKAGQIDLKLPFKSLFNKASEPIEITSFAIDGAHINILIDKDGNANYDIGKEKDNTGMQAKSDPFTFDLQKYEITNSQVTYDDAEMGLLVKVFELNHTGKGNLSAENSALKTASSALVSVTYDSINYLHKNNVILDADLKINLKDNLYTFLENNATVNQLPLVFDGFVKMNENDQKMELTFKTPSSDFKNFLALIPEVYSKNIEGVTTTGNFDVNGKIVGVNDDEHFPAFTISIHSDNASFKYPNLPKSLDKINIKTEISNKTGIGKDTYIDISQLSFSIDDDQFNSNAKLTNLTENMKVSVNINGILNLAKLEKTYPADAVKGLKGILKANASTNFDMRAIEKKQYEKTQTSGTFDLSNFEYNSKELSNTLKVTKSSFTFAPKTVNLKTFDAQLGSTDLNLTGTINNLLGFIFNNENIEGRFQLNSSTFSVNDFMTVKTDTAQSKKPKAQLKIPSFLDCTIDAKANTVIYDNISLKNVSGTLVIKDQKAELRQMRSDVFGGSLGFNGLVSTQKETPEFNMVLDAKNFDIGQSFTSLELFKSIAPIANAIKGKINTDITLSGNLNNNFTPNLSTITGNMAAQLLSSVITTENVPLLEKLQGNLNFLDVKKLDLNDLKTSLSFKDGKVMLKPFMIKYDDIEIAVSGSHGFDKSLAYDAVINIPAKYLGKEATNLIAQLSTEEQNIIKIPVNTLISGTFKNPNIKTDLKAAITNLGKQIANNQKEKLINKGKDEVTNALTQLLKRNQPKDSTKVSIKVDSVKVINNDKVKEVAKDALKNLLGGKKKKKDTVN